MTDFFSLQKHKRILLKVSGEFLGQGRPDAFCWDTLKNLAQSIQKTQHQWVIVVGGGNLWRGRQAPEHFCKHSADAMGMMATHINALALHAIFVHHGIQSCLLTSRLVEGIGKPFSSPVAQTALNNNHVVICSGGTGVGGITTDTAAVLRAYETNCSLIIKGTLVDGLYDQDPSKYPDARFVRHMTYCQAIHQQIGVMDTAALALAQEYKKITVIFSLKNTLERLFDNTAPHSVLCP